MKKAPLSLLMVVTAVLGDLGMAQAFDAGVEDHVVECSNKSNKRIVTLDYEQEGVYLPCQVIYEKPTEQPGYRKKMWYAKNTEGYCEKKMDEFLEKLEQWGWDCSSRKSNRIGGMPERLLHEWYVILGHFPQTEEGLKKAFALRNQFRTNQWNQDDFMVVESYYYADLQKERVYVMNGPFATEQKAQNWADQKAVQKIVPGASVQKATAKMPEVDS